MSFFAGDRRISHFDGFGPATVTAPPGTTTSRLVKRSCPELQTTPPNMPLSVGSGQQTARPFWGSEFSMMQGPLAFTDGQPAILAALSAGASDEETAVEMMTDVIARGPGSQVPAAVGVDYLVSVTLTANGIHIVSSLPEPFASYVITVDGVTHADKATGFNANSSSLAGGWTQIQSVLPLGMALSGSEFQLEQQGSGQDTPGTIEVML